MLITTIGKDLIEVSESNFNDIINIKDRVHLIHFQFTQPTVEKIKAVMDTFKTTNRFVISDNVKFYNSVLKNTGKKYYVMNKDATDFISFLRKNNKILIDFTVLGAELSTLLLKYFLSDLLRNTEIIKINKIDYGKAEVQEILNNWAGNVIIE